MSSAYKTSKTELVAIYRLEFYKQKKHWKFCQDVHKAKESKEEATKVTKPAKKSATEVEDSAKKLLNETYVVDKPASGIDDAFMESESDSNLAEPPPEPKAEPKGWTNSSRNIALTSILQSEASREPHLPLLPNTEIQDVSDGPTGPGPRDEPQKWVGDVEDMQPMQVWSEELEWQENCSPQVFQPELWSPTRASPLGFTRDKVWSKEDQIWPQSPESGPEPILWRHNELIWPAACQQAKAVDDTEGVWPAATHQRSKAAGETGLLWAAVTQQNQVGSTKLVWPDDSQQARTGGLMQWPPHSKGGGEGWDALRGGIEGVPQEVEMEALTPEVLMSTADEWIHEPLGDQDDWQDNCSHDCQSRSMCEFMRGAHCRKHSSEIALNCTRDLDQPRPVAVLSHAALCACLKRHTGAIHALLNEARTREQLSAELKDFAQHPHETSSCEEFPTRDVGLQGPPPDQGPPPQGPKRDRFISGSFLNDPCFDLESSSLDPSLGTDKVQYPGRGRGRLVSDRVIGIGPGGRPYRL